MAEVEFCVMPNAYPWIHLWVGGFQERMDVDDEESLVGLEASDPTTVNTASHMRQQILTREEGPANGGGLTALGDRCMRDLFGDDCSR